MEEKALLVTVEDHFLLPDRGLIVVPIPEFSKAVIEQIYCEIWAERPDGTSVCYPGLIHPPFFQTPPPTNWAIRTIMLKGATKEAVPIGSKLYVDKDVMDRLEGLEVYFCVGSDAGWHYPNLAPPLRSNLSSFRIEELHGNNPTVEEGYQ